MKKIITLAILSTISLVEPCFAVDFIKDKIYLSGSTSILSNSDITVAYPTFALGYHYTKNIKITVDSIIVPGDAAIFANLYYQPEIKNTDVTPYISAGVGNAISYVGDFIYQIRSGVNLPLSSRTNVFAGYRILVSKTYYGCEDKEPEFELGHAVELGVNFNL